MATPSGSNEDFGGGEHGTNGTTGAVYKAEGRFVAKVERRLNQRPRKTLGFHAPADKLQQSVATIN
jgi:hypothetical protein